MTTMAGKKMAFKLSIDSGLSREDAEILMSSLEPDFSRGEDEGAERARVTHSSGKIVIAADDIVALKAAANTVLRLAKTVLDAKRGSDNGK